MNDGQGELFPDLQGGNIEAVLADTAASIDALYRAAAAPGLEPPWRSLLERISRRTHMAPFNLMLADIQRPGAQYVAFREKWEQISREVRPGAIPIIVLWPFGPVRCAYDLSDTIGSENDDALLDQIFGAPMELPGDPVGRIMGRALKEDAIEIRIASLGSNLAGDARATGAILSKRGARQEPRWLVRIADHLNPAARLTTLIHELAHIYLGHLGGFMKKWPDRQLERKDAQEFEAEAVSYIVGQRFGLSTLSAEYLSGYLKPDTMEHVSVSAIARAAGRIEQHAR